MDISRVLIVSQVIPQWYVDLLSASLGKNTVIDIITNSDVKGNIIHSPAYNSSNFVLRIISWYKHYNFVTRWVSKNKKQNYDMIFAVSNPPINPLIGLRLSKTYNAPFIYMNWDLYPQLIRSSIHNPLVRIICDCWSRWNSRNYPKIDQIITIGNVVAASLNADLSTNVSVEVIPIGVDTDRLKPIPKKQNPFCVQNKLDNKFVILYSGKMGLGHNIEMILEASDKLSDIKDMVFVFIGFGPKYEMVSNYIKSKNPQNVLLFPLQSEDVFPYSMACGDVGIVSQEASLARLFMPSKTYSLMACGEAIIGIGTSDDDLSNMIRNDGIGISVQSGDTEELVSAIRKLYNDKSALLEYKMKARTMAVEKYDLSVVEKSYFDLFCKFK